MFGGTTQGFNSTRRQAKPTHGATPLHKSSSTTTESRSAAQKSSLSTMTNTSPSAVDTTRRQAELAHKAMPQHSSTKTKRLPTAQNPSASSIMPKTSTSTVDKASVPASKVPRKKVDIGSMSSSNILENIFEKSAEAQAKAAANEAARKAKATLKKQEAAELKKKRTKMFRESFQRPVVARANFGKKPVEKTSQLFDARERLQQSSRRRDRKAAKSKQSLARVEEAKAAKSPLGSGALAASATAVSQTSDKVEPTVEVNSDTFSTEAPSTLRGLTSSPLSQSALSDDSAQDVELPIDHQNDEDKSDRDTSTPVEDVVYLRKKQLCEGILQLNESQASDIQQLIKYYCNVDLNKKGKKFTADNIPDRFVLMFLTQVNTHLSSNTSQVRSDADEGEQVEASSSEAEQTSDEPEDSTPSTNAQVDDEQTGTEQTATSPEVTVQPEQEGSQLETSQPLAIANGVNKHGKRTLVDQAEPSQGPEDHTRKRARSLEPYLGPRDKIMLARTNSLDESTTPSRTQKPATAESGMIKAGIIPATNGDMIAFGATVNAAASYSHIEELSKANMSKELEPKQKGQKRTAMEAELPQLIQQLLAKKSKCSDEENVLRDQAEEATGESQAEAKVTWPEEAMDELETAPSGDNDRYAGVAHNEPSVLDSHQATNDEAASETGDRTTSEENTESKDNEDSNKSPNTKTTDATTEQQKAAETNDKAKSDAEKASSTPETANNSAQNAEKQQDAAHNNNDDNRVVKPSVAEAKAAVQHNTKTANNSNNSNTEGKTKAADEKSVSKAKAKTKEKQTATTMSKQTSTKRGPSALDAKKNTTMEKTSSKPASSTPAAKKRPTSTAPTGNKSSTEKMKKSQMSAPGNRFISTPKEEIPRPAQRPIQPQSTPAAIKPAPKKALADKTNTHPQPQQGRGSTKAATKKAPVSNTKKQPDAAEKKSVPAKAVAQKKRRRDDDEEAETASMPVKKQRTTPSPTPASVPASRDSEPAQPRATRASRSKTAAEKQAATARQPAVKRKAAPHLEGLSSGEDSEDEKPQPKKKAKTQASEPAKKEEAPKQEQKGDVKNEETVPAADTTSAPSAADNTQDAPANDTTAQPQKKKGSHIYQSQKRKPQSKTAPKDPVKKFFTGM